MNRLSFIPSVLSCERTATSNASYFQGTSRTAVVGKLWWKADDIPSRDLHVSWNAVNRKILLCIFVVYPTP